MGYPYKRGRFLFALWTVICCFAMIVMPMSLRAQRETKSLNHDWKFLKGECTSAADSTFNDSQWANIHLPHTWNTDAYTEKDYYRGIGWYRHRITLPKNWKGKQVFLKLDAANKAATFFINGKNIGEHALVRSISPPSSLSIPPTFWLFAWIMPGWTSLPSPEISLFSEVSIGMYGSLPFPTNIST